MFLNYTQRIEDPHRRNVDPKKKKKKRHKRAQAVSFHLYNIQKEGQLIYTARNQNWSISLKIVNWKGT